MDFSERVHPAAEPRIRLRLAAHAGSTSSVGWKPRDSRPWRRASRASAFGAKRMQPSPPPAPESLPAHW